MGAATRGDPCSHKFLCSSLHGRLWGEGWRGVADGCDLAVCSEGSIVGPFDPADSVPCGDLSSLAGVLSSAC